MANEISTLTDLNGVTHDIEDSTARSAIQTLDGQAVKSVNGQTPTAGAVLIGAGNIGYDNTSSGMTADDLQEAVDELHTDLGTKANTSDLAAVATSGSAADVSYDNTNSGLTADDVQEAVDELNGTLSSHISNTDIHVTATDKANWNAKADDSAVVKSVNSVNPVTGNVTLNAGNIPAEGYGNKSVSGNPITITDGTATTAKNLDVSLTPIQDLHGYANPWPAGGGRNMIPDGTDSTKGYFANAYVNDNGQIGATIYGYLSEYFAVTGGETYTWGQGSGVSSTDLNSIAICFYDENQNFISGTAMYRIVSHTIVAPSNAVYARSSQRYNPNELLQCELGSTPTVATPYSNICPISGLSSVSVVRTGFNQWDEETEEGWLDGITGAPVSESSSWRSKNYSSCLGNTNYSFVKPDVFAYCYWYDANKNFISRNTASGSITSPQNARYFKVACYHDGATYNHNVSLNYPSTETTYHAYQGSTATITLGQTVYQGTVDFDTGSLVVDRGFVTFVGSSSENWGVDNGGKRVSTNAIMSLVKKVSTGVANIKSNMFAAATSPSTYTGNIGISVDNGGWLCVSDGSGSMTVEGWKTYLASNNLQVCYELATPQTYQLTPAQLTLLEGYNYITTDANSISMDYYGSEATNVQAEINEFETNLDRLAGSIAQIEVSPATATHKVGDLIVWNSQLYRVTSAIAVGETLSVGSNVVSTSVGNELNINFAKVEGRIGNTLDTNVFVSVPAGFIDAFIIGHKEQVNTDTGIWYSNSGDVQVAMDETNGLRIKTSFNGFLGRKFEVLLLKK